MYGFCSAEYTTAWQLGVVMYQLLHNNLPFDCDYKIINQNPPILADISNSKISAKRAVDTTKREITLWITLTRVFHFCKECRDFLTGCLRKHYKDRFTLEDLWNHMWLK